MKINRAHKIELNLNNKQAGYMQRAAGSARFTYNWGLTEWKRSYEAGEKPSAYGLKRTFNSIKREQFPWIREVTKCAPEAAFANLGKAFSGFFRSIKQGKKAGYPRYKKRGLHDSFGLANDKVRTEGKQVRIPKLGWVRMREGWRFPNDRLLSATVSKKSGRWFISFNSEAEVKPCLGDHVVGVDVGIKTLAVTSDGQTFENPKAYRKAQPRLRLLQKAIARKQKGSNNRKKAVFKLQKQHYRISNIRKDSLHKASHMITKAAGLIGIEDLHIKGMLKNRRLSKAMSDAGLSELLRQIEYKAVWRGAFVVKADRFYPSSKTCSGCGLVKADLTLSMREYECDACGLVIDRDLNASINLKQYAVGSTVKACRLGSAGLDFGSSETTDWAGISRNPCKRV